MSSQNPFKIVFQFVADKVFAVILSGVAKLVPIVDKNPRGALLILIACGSVVWPIYVLVFHHISVNKSGITPLPHEDGPAPGDTKTFDFDAEKGAATPITR